MESRFVIVDIGSGYPGELAGHDLCSTDAPVEVLTVAALQVGSMPEELICGSAEETFVREVKKKGYNIEILHELDQLPIVRVVHPTM